MGPRSLVVKRSLAGRTVLDLLRGHFRLAPADVRRLLKNNGIRLAGAVCRDLTRRVRVGQKLLLQEPEDRPGRDDFRAARSPRESSKPRSKPRPSAKASPGPAREKIPIVYVDKHIVVVDKPAGLTTVRHSSERAEQGDRAQRFLPATLVDVLTAQLGTAEGRVRAVHRLDKETSGLVILARSAEAETLLGTQFRAHSVERTYLALVRGTAKNQTIDSQLVRDRGDGRRGSCADERGQRAVTHVRVVEELPGFTLVECRLETGRTHQVRIHLGEQGTPLCGEHIYDRPLDGPPQPDTSGALRIALHAATLAFEHPISRKRLVFESPLPADLHKLLKQLRKS